MVPERRVKGARGEATVERGAQRDGEEQAGRDDLTAGHQVRDPRGVALGVAEEA